MTVSPMPSAVDRAIGSRWRVIRLASPDGAWEVPPDGRPALLNLQPEGRFVCGDTVNALSGTYEKTLDGLVQRCATTTTAGYDGRDPHRGRLINAMNTMSNSRIVISDTDAEDEIIVSADSLHLTFTRHPPSSRTH
jgi:hypothetical protein